MKRHRNLKVHEKFVLGTSSRTHSDMGRSSVLSQCVRLALLVILPTSVWPTSLFDMGLFVQIEL